MSIGRGERYEHRDEGRSKLASRSLRPLLHVNRSSDSCKCDIASQHGEEIDGQHLLSVLIGLGFQRGIGLQVISNVRLTLVPRQVAKRRRVILREPEASRE